MKTIKKVYQFIFILILIFSISGCKEKTKELNNSQLLLDTKINELMFNMTCYAVTGKKAFNAPNVERFYYPEQLKFLLSAKFFSRSYAEDYFPNYIGIMDSIGFYDAASEKIDWVDDLLIRIEEERIASELNELDESFEDTVLDEPTAEEIEKIFSGEIEVKELKGKTSELTFMEFDNEIFIPQKTVDGYITIHSAGNDVTRNFYDTLFRLSTKEIWSIGNVSNSVLKQKEDFVYAEDSYTVLKKKITLQETEEEISYNSEGLVIKKNIYALYKDKPFLINEYAYSYNGENKILQESFVEYKYNQNYTKKIDSFSKLHTYEYNQNEEIPADFEYYENNVLKMKNTYSNEKGKYTSQIFFEEGFSVKTYYENDARVKDVYTQNNNIIRVKNYEN